MNMNMNCENKLIKKSRGTSNSMTDNQPTGSNNVNSSSCGNSLQNCERDGVPDYVGEEMESICTTFESPFELHCSPPSTITVESTTSSESSSWVWNVEHLPKVLPHVPLERGSFRLCGIQVPTITRRITDFMRLYSIACSYHTKKAARVDCMTECGVKFVVQIWREDMEVVVVEIQRRRGCSVILQRIRRCLFKSLIGEEEADVCCLNLYEGRQRRRPSPVLEKRIFQELKQSNKLRCRPNDARLLCLRLLESTKNDERRLGIESFLMLTDPTKTCRMDAEEMARSLIFKEGVLAERFQQAYLVFFQRRWREGDRCSDTECEISDDDASCLEFSSKKCELFREHLLALKVLVNALDVLACHERDYLSNDAAMMIQIYSPFWTEILNILIRNLQESCQRPQEAALSVKCIRLLESLEHEVVPTLVDAIIAPMLVSAYEFGKARHLSLQKESAELVSVMESSRLFTRTNVIPKARQVRSSVRR